MRLLNTLVFATTATLSAAAWSAPLTATDILGQFNAVVTGKFTSTSDVEGRLLANEITGGATFYNKPGTSTSAFAAVNAITIDSGLTNGNVDNGGSVNYQVSNAGHFNLNGGGSVVQTPSFTMAEFKTPLDVLAKQLSELASNSSVNASDPNNFTFAESGSGVAVFDLTASELSLARNIDFTGDAQTIIINVTGNYTDTTNFNASDFLNTHVIWNFVDATSLSFQGWHGTVLAGNASVTNSSAMEGFLYAANFTGNGELHNFAFGGTLPVSPVPEPSVPGLLCAGLLVVAMMARRRQAPSANA